MSDKVSIPVWMLQCDLNRDALVSALRRACNCEQQLDLSHRAREDRVRGRVVYGFVASNDSGILAGYKRLDSVGKRVCDVSLEGGDGILAEESGYVDVCSGRVDEGQKGR